MEQVIQIGMAELAVAQSPVKIVTLGLGSCIGVCIYDPLLKIGGMAHIMLPDSELARGSVNPAKFADTAVPLLTVEIEKLGAPRGRFQIKMAGGAQMFAVPGDSNFLSIGAKNIQAVEDACYRCGLKIVARSVGGNSGKSITLDLETGILHVKTIYKGNEAI